MSTLISGSGNNYLDGGTGSDTVDYSYLTGTDFGDDDATDGQVSGDIITMVSRLI